MTGGYFTAVWENVIRPVTDALGVTEYIETAWSAVQNALDSILNAIGSVFSTMWGVVEPIVDALRSPGGVGAAWQAVQDALAPVLDWIGRKFETVMGYIQPVLDALNWTLDNAGAAVAALGLGDGGSVMDGRGAAAPGDGAAPRPGTTAPPALTNGPTPYSSIPSATDMLGVQQRARGGAFRPGWLLTGEDGPELEYRSEGGFIAHTRALTGMLAMAERTRALMGGIDMGGIASAAVPALATVAAAAGPVMQRGPVTLSPTYNVPMSFEAGADPEEIRATMMDVLGEMQDRAQAELRSVLHD